MKANHFRALGALLALALAAPGTASADQEVDRLRAEFEQKLKALQQSYEERLQALEARLASQAQAQVPSQAQLAPAPVEPTAVAVPASAATANAFNPEISLVLQGAYVKQKDLAQRPVTGFLTESTDPGQRGFTLGGTELVMSANIDPQFRGYANFSVADDKVAVEEAWFQSLGLGNGLTLKGGRFVSGVGYANEQHPHAWDFADQSLMYRVLFGEHLVQDGLQLKWLAPTDTYLEFGAEAARGQAFPGSDAAGNRNGAGTWAAFAHAGGDIGESHSWRAGLSYVAARPQAREAVLRDSAAVDTQTSFSGKSKSWLADFVWKWAPNGNSRAENFKLQAELFRRDEDGAMNCADNLAEGGACGGLSDAYRARQSGGYLQGVYQFMPSWRVGYRYDRLNPGSVTYASLPFASGSYHPVKHSLMADYSPSEFTRFRLQLAQDKAQQGITDNQLTLQYIFSLGTHGAHKF